MKTKISKISKCVSVFGACLTIMLFILPEDRKKEEI